MAVPIITSIAPSTGPTLGRTLVTLTGTNMALPPPPPASGPSAGLLPTTVEVLFGGVLAREVQVRVDTANPPDGTIVTCLSPPHALGVVDTVLRNLDALGQPVPGEEVTTASAYTFEAADLTQESTLTRLVRSLLQSIKAQVLENLSITVHTDFDDTPGDQLHIAAASTLPALVLVGPELTENRFYSINEQPQTGGDDGPGLPFAVRRVPYTVDLSFELVGMSEHTVELLNLMSECTLYFHANKTMELDRVAGDPSQGQVEYEMDFAPDGQFKIRSRPNESNVRNFLGSFVIRGFDLERGGAIVVTDGRTTDGVSVDLEQTGSEFPVGPSPSC